ncbi:hypothetical protein GCM10027186_52270 [Micromonospora schwarzwaldensis]
MLRGGLAPAREDPPELREERRAPSRPRPAGPGEKATNEAPAPAGAKVWWHREDPLARTSRG